MAFDFVDWQTKTEAPFVQLREGYFSLPAFSLSGLAWAGHSELVRQYNYNASAKFVIVDPPSRPDSPTFLLCVRWRSGETVTRYKLWDDLGQALGLIGAPVYDGQVIPKNFVLEIWTIKDQTAPELASPLTITTTIRKLWDDARDVSSYEDDDDPRLVTDYDIQMPSRGTGHSGLYTNSNFVGSVFPTALASWLDESGNGYDLDQKAGTVQIPAGPYANWKTEVPVHFSSLGGELAAAVAGSPAPESIYLTFRTDSWVTGDKLVQGSFNVAFQDNAGSNDIRWAGTNFGLDFPLNTDILLFLSFYQILGNWYCTASSYGDYETSVTIGPVATSKANAVFQIADAGNTMTLEMTEVAVFDSPPAIAVAEAERDYLINKYIGWLVEGSFNSEVAGEDNP